MDTLNNSISLTILRRRSSIFKPTSEDDECLRKSVDEFITLYRVDHLSTSNAPITWERLSTGYRIVDLQIDRTAEILELLKNYFFCTEDTCASSYLYIDARTIKKYQEFFLNVVSDFNSFCALEEGTGKIVGVAIAKITDSLSDSTIDLNIYPYQDIFNILKFENTLLTLANVFENYGVDKYFCIHAVCVMPEYYDKGVGTSLVRACLSKARKIYCPVCVGIFPAGSSQSIAQRFEFETLAEVPWISLNAVSPTRQPTLLHNSGVLETSYVSCMGIVLDIDDTSSEEMTEEMSNG